MTDATLTSEIRSAWFAFGKQMNRSFGIASDAMLVRAPTEEALNHMNDFERKQLLAYLRTQTLQLAARIA